MKSKKKIIIILSIIFVLIIGLSFVSELKFGTMNVPRIIYAMITVNTGDNEYVIVKDSDTKNDKFATPKKVIIASPNEDYNFYNYLESNGYNILDRFGSQIIIEKDNKKEEVYISTNKYFNLWQWY